MLRFVFLLLLLPIRSFHRTMACMLLLQLALLCYIRHSHECLHIYFDGTPRYSLYLLDISCLRKLYWLRCCRCIPFDDAEHAAKHGGLSDDAEANLIEFLLTGMNGLMPSDSSKQLPLPEKFYFVDEEGMRELDAAYGADKSPFGREIIALITKRRAAIQSGDADIPVPTFSERFGQGLSKSKYLLVSEYDMSWKVATVTSWGGLRGAVGLCLAMMVSQEFGSKHNWEHSKVPLGPKFMFHMAGIAFLTLVINGSTSGALVHGLGLVTAPPEAKVAWNGVTMELHHKLKDLIRELKNDPMYRWANWDEVLKHLPAYSQSCKADLNEYIEQLYAFEEHGGGGDVQRKIESLNAAYLAKVESRFVAPKMCRCCLRFAKVKDLDSDEAEMGGAGERADAAAAVVPADPHQSDEAMDAMMWPFLMQARERFLNLVVAAYWEELEVGKISERSFNMLRHATDLVRDQITLHRTVPPAEGDARAESGLAEWITVEGLTVNHFLHFIMGAIDHGPLKKIVHLRTARYWDLIIDVSTTFIDVHQKVLHEFKEGLKEIQEMDEHTHSARDYMRDTAITQGVIREAEFDLALAHRIFESVPHTSIIGRHSLTSICIRHIHKMCEKEVKEVFEEGELNESEFDLLMWGIARCESAHAWKKPDATCAKQTSVQLMLKKNLSKAMYADPERSARMIEAINKSGKRKVSERVRCEWDDIVLPRGRGGSCAGHASSPCHPFISPPLPSCSL